MDRVASKKRPRYYYFGKSHIAVKGTEEEIAKMDRAVESVGMIAKGEAQAKERIRLEHRIRDYN